MQYNIFPLISIIKGDSTLILIATKKINSPLPTVVKVKTPILI